MVVIAVSLRESKSYGSVFTLVSDLRTLSKEVSSSMVSHSLLYLNVMSFGSLQTVFMARNGIDEYDIGYAGSCLCDWFHWSIYFPLFEELS